jgi:hypothetical protein
VVDLLVKCTKCNFDFVMENKICIKGNVSNIFYCW